MKACKTSNLSLTLSLVNKWYSKNFSWLRFEYYSWTFISIFQLKIIFLDFPFCNWPIFHMSPCYASSFLFLCMAHSHWSIILDLSLLIISLLNFPFLGLLNELGTHLLQLLQLLTASYSSYSSYSLSVPMVNNFYFYDS